VKNADLTHRSSAGCSPQLPLMVEAFEGETAETTTMLQVIGAFVTAHRPPDVTIVASAGISDANRRTIEAADDSPPYLR
jgi:hypothetical protein